MKFLPVILASALLGQSGATLHALESERVERPGIRGVRLITAASALVPGEKITVGLHLEPAEGHHTYWRGPGIVGVATGLEWTLPSGFQAGPLLWPPPAQVDMAGITANGFKTPVLLLCEIEVPATLKENEVVLSARASWMACAVSCNPGLANLSLTMPVAPPGSRPPRDEAVAARIEAARKAVPPPAPANWKTSARLASPERIELDLVIPDFDPSTVEGIHFHSDDMQVDSDEPQELVVIDAGAGAFRLVLARPNFAPEAPPSLSGVLHNPQGWPETGSTFVEIIVPWPPGTFAP